MDGCAERLALLGEKAWRDRHDLSRGDVDALLAAIGDALSGNALLREELAEEVAARVGTGLRARLLSGWGELLGPAARLGLLRHGPSRGTKVTFVRADE